MNIPIIIIITKGNCENTVMRIVKMPALKKCKYVAVTCLAKTHLVAVVNRCDPHLGRELLEAAKDASLCNHVSFSVFFSVSSIF